MDSALLLIAANEPCPQPQVPPRLFRTCNYAPARPSPQNAFSNSFCCAIPFTAPSLAPSTPSPSSSRSLTPLSPLSLFPLLCPSLLSPSLYLEGRGRLIRTRTDPLEAASLRLDAPRGFLARHSPSAARRSERSEHSAAQSPLHRTSAVPSITQGCAERARAAVHRPIRALPRCVCSSPWLSWMTH